MRSLPPRQLFFKTHPPRTRSVRRRFQMLGGASGRLSCLARLARYLASAILSCATVSALFKSSRLNAPRCAPDCMLNRCVAVGDTDGGEVAHARGRRPAHGCCPRSRRAPLAREAHEDVLAQDAVFQAPRRPRGSPAWRVTTFAQSAPARASYAMGQHQGQLQLHVPAIFRRLARRSMCDCDSSSSAARVWIAEDAQRGRLRPRSGAACPARRKTGHVAAGASGEAQQAAAHVAVVEDRMLQRVVSAQGHQDRGPGEEVARDTRGVVRAHHQRPRAPLLRSRTKPCRCRRWPKAPTARPSVLKDTSRTVCDRRRARRRRRTSPA